MNWFKKSQNKNILQYWQGIIESQITQFPDLDFIPNMTEAWNPENFSFTITSKTSTDVPYIVSCTIVGKSIQASIAAPDSVVGDRIVGTASYNILQDNDAYKIIMDILSTINNDVNASFK